jgi:hypothetical protein
MQTILPPELEDPALRRSILAALRRTYEVSQDRHDPNAGDDALTFGIHTWKSSTHFLPIELGALGDGVSWQVANQSLEVRVGRCRLRVLKLGTSDADNPWHCFPDHPGPAARMGRSEQLELSLGLEEPLDWVIGHYGSVEDGLRAVRLQAVGNERSDDGRITRWSAIETLFEVGSPSRADLRVLRGAHDDVVAIPEAKVALRNEATEETDGQPS